RVAATTALSLSAFSLVHQEILHADQQERAEFTGARLHTSERMPLEEAPEKLLGEILRLVVAGALATDEDIQWIPIGRTQVGQGFSGRGSVSGLRHQDGG